MGNGNRQGKVRTVLCMSGKLQAGIFPPARDIFQQGNYGRDGAVPDGEEAYVPGVVQSL